jgi:cardiolipin synthase
LQNAIDWPALTIFITDLSIRVGLSVRVIMRRRPVGVSLAWLTIILIFPFVGAAIYLLIGELRLGRRRARIAELIHVPYQRWLDGLRRRTHVDWSVECGPAEPLARLAEVAGGIPAQPGNELRLLHDAEAAFDALVADIDAAERTCHLEFYIWFAGGRADGVADALLRARARGVTCRVLVDAVGSHVFLRSGLISRLRDAGVEVQAALPVNPLRMLFVRFDLRLHRKIVVIDGETAYTGSMNLADPHCFKPEARVGQWVDAMVRVRGPAVEALAIIFLEDWELETGAGVERLADSADARPQPARGSAIAQLVPSGPVLSEESIQSVLLLAIYSAHREIVLTTPYFVPDEPLVTALTSAALRGVRVTLILPARVDSRLASLASQPHQDDLLEAGATIALFQDGLLHTKSVTVDGELSLFGSLNLDPRSLILNFEATLAVYDRDFTAALRGLQETYLARSRLLDLDERRARPALRRFAEDAARLLSPLL